MCLTPHALKTSSTFTFPTNSYYTQTTPKSFSSPITSPHHSLCHPTPSPTRDRFITPRSTLEHAIQRQAMYEDENYWERREQTTGNESEKKRCREENEDGDDGDNNVNSKPKKKNVSVEYSQHLARALFPDTSTASPTSAIIANFSFAPFSPTQTSPSNAFNATSIDSTLFSPSHLSSVRALYRRSPSCIAPRATPRHIPSKPTHILDAPSLQNDYYLNLLDWSKTGLLAIGLGNSVYIWKEKNGQSFQLVEGRDGRGITSVKWKEDGTLLSIGYHDSSIEIWDIRAQSIVSSVSGHSTRVACMDWKNENLASGGLDATIHIHDTRTQQAVKTYNTHTEEVCGLKYSPDGSQLASGGNDNLLCIFNCNGLNENLILKHHKAAVKALAWCPFQDNTLVSGGGLADGHIRFTNTRSGSEISNIDTKSQVCSLQWSKSSRELISAHGHPNHTLCIWKFPSLEKIATLEGHTSRVLHTSLSPDGATCVSGSADEVCAKTTHMQQYAIAYTVKRNSFDCVSWLCYC